MIKILFDLKNFIRRWRYVFAVRAVIVLYIAGEILWSRVSMRVFLIGIQRALCLLVAVLSG